MNAIALLFKRKELERTRELLEGYGQESFVGRPKRDQDGQTKGAVRSSKRELILLTLLGLSIVLALVLQTPFALLAGVVPIFLFRPKEKKATASVSGQKERNFEQDYPSFLITLASSVGSGIDPIVAMSEAEELFDGSSELKKQLKVFNKNIEQGLSEEKCIREFAVEINHPDLELFRTAFMLARNEGSSLGACLQRLAKTTRQRQSFRRKMRSAVAMQRLSTIAIATIAILAAFAQFVASSELREKVFTDPTGLAFVAAGGAMVLFGVYLGYEVTKAKH